MTPELEAKKTAALAAGWTVQTVTNDTGRTVYQLYDPTGAYVCSHTNQDSLWVRAEKRELLPA